MDILNSAIPAPSPGPPQGLHAPRRAARGLYGALDLGTNNCRLLIARPAQDSGGHESFQVIDAFSRIVRLGEGLMANGALSDAAMDRAVAALAVCAEKLARRGVGHVRSVATEACRRATNAAHFVARVYAETGLALDVISPREEARLAVLGCQTLIDPTARRALVFDIGGGSTEVVLVKRRDDGFTTQGWVSVPWGVVSLAETELHDAGDAPARTAAYARMKARVASHLGGLSRQMRRDVQLLGASGTVTTLASLNMGLPHYDRRQVDGAWADPAAMRALAARLAALSPAERAAVPGIGADRADLVVAGAAILEAVMDSSPHSPLRVADRGLREGILRAMMARP